MVKDKKVLITGGGGFLGVSLAERLVKDNQVVLLDTNFTKNTFAYSDLKGSKNIELAEVDILDAAAVAGVARDAQIVVHMAAMVGVQEVLSNALYTLDVNYIGTSNLLKAVAQNPRCERVVCFSTSEVFGAGAFGIAEDGNTVLSSVQDVRWCYCISKLASEQLALSYYRQQNLPAVVIRPFNIFGPKRVGDHVVLRFILKALKNEDLEVYGDGTQIRAWCYVDDFTDALLRCLEVKEAVGQAFNIGNARNTLTIYELAKKIISLCKSQSRIVFKALDFTDVDIRVPNIAKARDILGYEPKIDLEEGLARTIAWVRGNAGELESRIRTERRTYIPEKGE
jgi:nucleoside-diphosphate-sugar epimerase